MKRAAAGALALVLIMCIGFALASAGSSSDPLISKEYADGDYTSQVISEGTEAIRSALVGVYNDALEDLSDKAYGSSGYEYAQGYAKVTVPAGEYVRLYTGGSLVLRLGSAEVYPGEGTVIDLTDGSEMRNGQTVEPNVRYFAAEDTQAVFEMTDDSTVLVNGYYVLADSQELPPDDPDVPDDPQREFGPDTFIDVSASDWFYDAIEYVYTNYIFNGVETNEFGVYQKITRADFVTVLYRLAGSPEVTEESGFPDVQDSTQYYYDAIVWAAGNGIVLGHDTGLFAPEDPVNREEMTSFMYRFAKNQGYSLSVSDPDRFNSFPDAAEVSDWAVEPMTWAVGNSIINGSDGYLAPRENSERCQVAQVFYNLHMFAEN